MACMDCSNTFITVSEEIICLRCILSNVSNVSGIVCSAYIEEFMFSNDKYINMMKRLRKECNSCGIIDFVD